MAGSARPDDLVDAHVAMLERLPCAPEAVGVGGSHGRRAADPYSDLDFFLFVPDQSLWSFVERFDRDAVHPLPVVSSGVGRFVADYGYRMGYLFEGGVKIEYYVNSPRTLTSLPLSARIVLRYDRTGVTTRRLAQARADFERDVRTHVRAGVHDCLSEIHDIRKYAARGDVHAILWRLGTLRRPVLALAHMARSADVYAPSGAVARLHTRDPELLAVVDRTVPTPHAAAVHEAYAALRALMLSSWETFSPLGVPDPAQRAMEEVLSREAMSFMTGNLSARPPGTAPGASSRAGR